MALIAAGAGSTAAIDGSGRAILQSAGTPHRNRASPLSVQEVSALEQQFPPTDEQHAATEIEIDRKGFGSAAER